MKNLLPNYHLNGGICYRLARRSLQALMKLSSDYLPMISGYLPIFRRDTRLERRESSNNRQVILPNRQICLHPCPRE